MPGLEINQVALWEMKGAIDGATVGTFQEGLEHLKKTGVRQLILDMSKIKYVNSTGLASLLKYADAFRAGGGGMCLINVSKKVKIVIEMLSLQTYFDIAKDLDGALDALSKVSPAPIGQQGSGPAMPPPPPRGMPPPPPPGAPQPPPLPPR